MAFRNRNARTGASTYVTKPKIFWDASKSKYCLATPYADAFKNDLQVCCGTAFWGGKSEPYWFVEESDLDAAKACVESYWPEYDFTAKPTQQQNNNNSSNGSSSSANEAALTMFRLGGYDTARKIYSMLILKYHPDKNPDPAAHQIAAQITTSWKKLKQEMGW